MTQRDVDYNEYAKRVHELNKNWWHDLDGNPIERNKPEMFMLMLSEISEAMEGARKNLMDDHLPHRKMEEVEVADFVIRLLDFTDGFGYKLHKRSKHNIVEAWEGPVGERLFDIALLVFRIYWLEQFNEQAVSFWINLTLMICEQYCDYRDFNLWDAVDEKLEYNKTRKDHQIEARKQENGKKW